MRTSEALSSLKGACPSPEERWGEAGGTGNRGDSKSAGRAEQYQLPSSSPCHLVIRPHSRLRGRPHRQLFAEDLRIVPDVYWKRRMEQHLPDRPRVYPARRERQQLL